MFSTVAIVSSLLMADNGALGLPENDVVWLGAFCPLPTRDGWGVVELDSKIDNNDNETGDSDSTKKTRDGWGVVELDSKKKIDNNDNETYVIASTRTNHK